MTETPDDDQHDEADGGMFASLTPEPAPPPRPIPNWAWIVLALLMSATLFLAVRLAIVRTEPPPARIAAPAPQPIATATPAPAPRPPSSDEALRALVESWRLAWQGKDADGYLSHYASTFGSRGKDRNTWAEQKARTFAGDQAIEVGVSELEATIGDDIVILTFIQDYRSGTFSDRGRKRLYLLAEDGAWRIFNEEWEALD